MDPTAAPAPRAPLALTRTRRDVAAATTRALEPEGSDDDEDEGPKKKGPEQDHYAILGLGKLRWKATDKHIKDGEPPFTHNL